jgi:hypothetical protein
MLTDSGKFGGKQGQPVGSDRSRFDCGGNPARYRTSAGQARVILSEAGATTTKPITVK